MAPQAEEHGVRAGVLHQKALDEAVSLQPVGDGEAEGEGVGPAGFGGVGEGEGHGLGGFLGEGELRVLGEPVDGQGVGFSAIVVLLFGEPGHIGEEDGGLVGPDLRIALPEVLCPVGPDAGELGSQTVDGDGEDFVSDGMQQSRPPFC